MKNEKKKEVDGQDPKQPQSHTDKNEEWDKDWTLENFVLNDGPEEDDY
ncbi:MAG: hypothetical protein UU48_C0006G0020 [Candidatus Uhrbacteria bacterium GW2011_GWF2_41_16]|uniref:Uncharacterized protein n=2 Tax=Candidatus Uhriibacteriota TaxID=1752732 RepID=A0A0G0XMG3_9BACT|nr:MAG: hypothetical protein UU35_C0015G0003 [Candidatus Uhrbacteria bacterium GW2011_GWC2_41_11]KKR97980.1 MAG: hypothetical protein UU48_C0006G0020 [Candidatus Uhrbacteria bacterium GW2011_GWF2_41_16]